MSTPLIAVVGRPNVGKSTLFNRLIGTRKAITDPTPGVTRDPIEGVWHIGGGVVRLADTGGVITDGDMLDDLVTERSRGYFERAHVILFLLEAKELAPEDEEIAASLRPWAEKVIVVVNKVDHEKHASHIWDFYSLGFEDVIGISATHGRGIEELEERVLAHVVPAEDLSIEEDRLDQRPLRIAILGKPNVGKSTLSNALTGTDASIVSPIAGTTRDVVEGRFEYKGREFQVLDTAGIRRKKRVTENVEYYSVNRAIAAIEECDVVYLLVDAAEGLSEQDKKIATQIVKQGRGVILVLNKWDLVDEQPNQIEAIKDRVRFLFPILNFAPLLPISAETGKGIPALLKKTVEIASQLDTRVPTPQLNNALAMWLTQQEPPRVKGGGRFKIYFATQVSANPVHFVCFVNHAKRCPQSYEQYLKNCIRRTFGFHSIPVSLSFREKQK